MRISDWSSDVCSSDLAQVAGRAQRLGLSVLGIKALAETAVERILEHAATVRPALVVADSIQTLWSEMLTAAPGSVSQVRESAARLVRYAKETGTRDRKSTRLNSSH